MTSPVTVIGGGTRPAPAVTSLGSLSGAPTPEEKPSVSAIKPTTLAGAVPASIPSKPVLTAMPGTKPADIPPARAAEPPKPTAIQSSKPVASGPVKPSMMPGAVRQVVDVPVAELAARFPVANAACLEQVKAVLASIAPENMDTVDWLRYGVVVQESVNESIKERLALASGDDARQVPALLTRLHKLLNALLDAMEGGFFKKPAKAVWHASESEIRQLESMLAAGAKALMDVLDKLLDIKKDIDHAMVRLEGTYLAGEYLFDTLNDDVKSVLQARLLAITKTQALMQENLLALQTDEAHFRELIVLVQDGVLLKLPAVYSQLASLPDKPNETQRYLVTEKLTDLVQSVERKL